MTTRPLTRCFLPLALLLGAGIPAAAQQAPSAVSSAAHGLVLQARPLPAEIAGLSEKQKVYNLQPLSAAERRARKRGPLVSNAVRRALPPPAMQSAALIPLPDGRSIWRLALRSPNATSVRVHFSSFNAAGYDVWVYSATDERPGSLVVGPYSGRGPNGDGEFWAASVQSDTAIIACILPAGAVKPPFEIDALSHAFQELTGDNVTEPVAQGVASPLLGRAAGFFAPLLLSAEHLLLPSPEIAGLPEATAADPAAPCNLDVSCYPAYAVVSKAVVQYSFQGDDGSGYLCSGAIINTVTSSFKPYLLTAHHCISSESEARSIQAHFFYQTASCNGAAPNLAASPIVIGGDYLAGAAIPGGDFAFVLLTGTPAGTTFAGWNTALDSGAQMVGIHHPKGSYKRISFGTRGADSSVNIEGMIGPAALFYQVPWTQGLTEPGSSGSPLMTTNGQIVGTLTGGPVTPPGQTACSISQYSIYGRFSNAYAAIQGYLNQLSAPNLNVNPNNLSFNVTDGAVGGSGQQTLLVQSQSTAAVNFTATGSTSWLKLTPASSQVTAGASATVTVSLDPTFFISGGAYSGSVSITANGATPVVIPVSVNVAITQSRITPSILPNPVYQQQPDADGYSWFYTITMSETAGLQSRLTAFSIDGTDYTQSIPAFFGTDIMNAFGTLTASLRSRGLTAPVTRVFQFAGNDFSGHNWSQTLRVPFNGPAKQAAVALSVGPNPVRSNPTANPNCEWTHLLTLQETSGFNVNLTRFLAGGNDLTSQIPNFFGSSTLPADGTIETGFCWSGVNVPTVLNFEVDGVDSAGNAVVATASANFLGSLTNPPAPSVSLSSVSLRAGSGSSTPSATSFNLGFGGGSVQWSTSLVPGGQGSDWLTISPVSGLGAQKITISADPTGLSDGVYQAFLLVVTPSANPQILSVPVTLTVGAGLGVSVTGLGNAASGQTAYAPGMILSVYGGPFITDQPQAATSIPLPLSVDSVSARINGFLTPLYYVGPNQVNVQIPYEVSPGAAILTVTAAGQTAAQSFTIGSAAPGIFTSDGRHVVPFASGRRGDTLVLFVTGEGYVSPPVATGNTPPATTLVSQLPRPLLPVSVTVGGAPATLAFAGIPSGLVGVTQINYQIPQGAALGEQPVVVTVGTQASPAAFITVTQ